MLLQWSEDLGRLDEMTGMAGGGRAVTAAAALRRCRENAIRLPRAMLLTWAHVVTNSFSSGLTGAWRTQSSDCRQSQLGGDRVIDRSRQTRTDCSRDTHDAFYGTHCRHSVLPGRDQ